MEKSDKGSTLTRMGVRGRMFLLVPAYPGCPEQTAVKWLLLLPLVKDVEYDMQHDTNTNNLNDFRQNSRPYLHLYKITP